MASFSREAAIAALTKLHRIVFRNGFAPEIDLLLPPLVGWPLDPLEVEKSTTTPEVLDVMIRHLPYLPGDGDGYVMRSVTKPQ